ncbi:unnamed protein product [Commensalibacter communis]|uniref:YdhR family protein n=1 Tax=Commensalibacter communis TaxID=2972786 RepID=UPI0022FF50A0|nr:YdhR family protein [Commensalibacter communis]CAI3949278.1 unnamed protein product [Commensalibacter communis]
MSVLIYFCFDWPKEAMGDALFNNAKTNEAGGIYLFTDHQHAALYIEKHTQRMTAFGAKNIICKIFDVNDKLTKITYGYL